MPLPLPPKRTMLARAARKRCPRCGHGRLFTNWFRMKERCPTCDLRFNRGEDGYTLGALWFNLLMAEAVTVGIFITTLVLTWPTPPWDVLRITSPIEAVVMPVLFFPFARTLFLAFDLCIRPHHEG